MNRKSRRLILVFLMGILLLAGCSSQKEDQGLSGEDGTQGATQETAQDTAALLPAEAKIGIAATEEDSEFTSAFMRKITGYLVTAGVPEEKIIEETGSADELSENASELIKEGCSVLVIGNANETNAPQITDAANAAEIPVLYFGTNPGEKERARWQDKKIRAAYVGGDSSKAAESRAAALDKMKLEKIDLNEDGEIGVIVIKESGESEGDRINQETLQVLEELGYTVNILSEDEETEEDSAYDLVVSDMEEYGSALEMIFCANEDQASDAWNAVADEKRLVGHDVMVFGYDAGTQILSDVAKGNVTGAFFNDFMAQSRCAADYVLSYLRGEEVPNTTLFDYVNVTVDNAQEVLDVLSSQLDQGDEEAEEDEDNEE